MYSPYPDAGTGDRVSRAERNSSPSRPEKSQRPGALRTESAKRFQLRDLRPHGVDNAPAAEVRPRRDGCMRRKNDEPLVVTPIVAHVVRAHVTGGVQRASNYSHSLLSVIATMPQAVCRRGNQLQFSKPNIHVSWRIVSQ